jgi:hypothetical protein
MVLLSLQTQNVLAAPDEVIGKQVIVDVAAADKTLICGVGDAVRFHIINPPSDVATVAIKVIPEVGEIPFNPLASYCQWVPRRPGRFDVSLRYKTYSGTIIVKSVMCNVVEKPPVLLEGLQSSTLEDIPLKFSVAQGLDSPISLIRIDVNGEKTELKSPFLYVFHSKDSASGEYLISFDAINEDGERYHSPTYELSVPERVSLIAPPQIEIRSSPSTTAIAINLIQPIKPLQVTYHISGMADLTTTTPPFGCVADLTSVPSGSVMLSATVKTDDGHEYNTLPIKVKIRNVLNEEAQAAAALDEFRKNEENIRKSKENATQAIDQGLIKVSVTNIETSWGSLGTIIEVAISNGSNMPIQFIPAGVVEFRSGCEANPKATYRCPFSFRNEAIVLINGIETEHSKYIESQQTKIRSTNDLIIKAGSKVYFLLDCESRQGVDRDVPTSLKFLGKPWDHFYFNFTATPDGRVLFSSHPKN